MPFFTNKFSPKRIPARKIDTNVVSREIGPEFASRELALDIPPPRLIIAKHEFLFEDGQWVLLSKSPGCSQKDDVKMKQLLEANEENNLLKLKFEVVLDMLTQTTVESQLHLKELEQLKRGVKAASVKRKH